MTPELPDTTAVSIDMANLLSATRTVSTALSVSDIDERDELLAWANATTELLTTLADQISDLTEVLRESGSASAGGE